MGIATGFLLALVCLCAINACVTPCPVNLTHQSHAYTYQVNDCGDTIWLRDDRNEWELYKQGKIDASEYERK